MTGTGRGRRFGSVLLAFVAAAGCESERPSAPLVTAPLSSAPPPAMPTPSAPTLSPEVVQIEDLDTPVKAKPIPPKPLPLVPSSEPIVAVKIGSQKASMPITLGGADAMTVGDASIGDSASRWTVRGPLEIRASPTGWVVKEQRGGASRHFTPCELSVSGSGGATGSPILWNGVKWPGTLRLVVEDGDGAKKGPPQIDLVIDIGIEAYLPGVIAKELYASWDPETFRAQAIAARSYATVEEDRWSGRRHWDMVAGQQSQAWAGETSNQRAIEAVRATRGEVLVTNGRVVPSYYSSSCGGRPASALNTLTDNPFHDIVAVSAGDQGPRAGRCCQGASVATWSVTIPLSSVRARLQAWGKANGRPDLAAIELPTAIEVSDRNAAGRATEVRVRSARGAVELGAEDFRWAMNAPRDKATTLKSGDIEVKIIKGKASAEVSGRGFGHGVGLCQHGAQAMAKSGASARSILERYYPGAAIVRGWD